MTYDFGGYATKHNIQCSDGRTITPEAFKDQNGSIVPLVWQHAHESVDNVLGHAELEYRPDGIYAYCSLNDTPGGRNAREIVNHGDVCALSIYANKLKEAGGRVMHGVIREVSLVLAGANPGATIDNFAFSHSDGTMTFLDDEILASFVGYDPILIHADDEDEPADEENQVQKAAEESDKTIEEIIETMNDEQKAALYAIVGALTEDEEEEPESKKPAKENEESSDGEEPEEEELKHAEKEDGKPEEDSGKESSKETIGDILDTLSKEQAAAVQMILDAIENDTGQVDEDTQKVFETLSDKQKDAVYALVGLAMGDEGGEAAHADDEGEPVGDSEDDETIEDVMKTLTDEQSAAVDRILDALENGEDSIPSDVAEIFNGLSDKQKDAVYTLVGLMIEEDKGSSEEPGNEDSNTEGEAMKHNVFDAETEGTVLTHSDMEAIFTDAPRIGSLRESVLQHGIEDIEVLFPEAQAVNAQPYQIARRMEWVSVVLNGVHKSPFSRLKSTAANLTEEQARAKGYVKGRKKIEEQISALKRVTTPQTVYKLQKLDRDDIIDITDFDVVAWMKQEMRMMLDEEIARAILIGDGRLTSDPEKIMPDHIRPVWSDDDMYTIHKVIAAANATDYTAMIDEIVRSRKDYKGSGTPIMFIGPDILTEMRLLKDQDNKMRYASDNELAEVMRVSAIHEVELFDDAVRTVEGKDRKLVAIILNLADYTVGATKGGEVSLFDDFDLDYNKYEYLIETRISGALTMPKSAIAIEIQTTTDSVADPIYVRVASPVTADIDDYYEQDEYGRYVKTVDQAVVTGKRYYEVDE